MRHRWLLLATILLPTIGACSTSTDASSPSASRPAASSVASSPAASSQGSVGVAGFKFAPPDVHVPLGGSVVWKNNDSQPHTATSAGAFDAGTIEPGKTAVVVFRTAGTFRYMCAFHPFMTGTVTVG